MGRSLLERRANHLVLTQELDPEVARETANEIDALIWEEVHSDLPAPALLCAGDASLTPPRCVKTSQCTRPVRIARPARRVMRTRSVHRRRGELPGEL